MSTNECTEERFLQDVADHRMTIIRDDGVHRHIRFSKPETVCMHFDFITWPGYLCYTGDMGTYVFRRLEDMFEFFRKHPSDKATLPISPSYWEEKTEAVDRSGDEGRTREYSAEMFKASVREWVADMAAGMGEEERTELLEAIEFDVLDSAEYGEEVARKAVYDFEWKQKDEFGELKETDVFPDFQGQSFREFTYRYLWCCYALVWGIRQYDAAKGISA